MHAAVGRLVKDVFESAAGLDAVNAVSDYLRSQRVTSLPDLQVSYFSLTPPSLTLCIKTYFAGLGCPTVPDHFRQMAALCIKEGVVAQCGMGKVDVEC